MKEYYRNFRNTFKLISLNKKREKLKIKLEEIDKDIKELMKSLKGE